MKKFKIYSAMASLVLSMLATSCDSEKDLVIIDGNLPIKTTSLYMLGDATPNGWDNGNPTPLLATEEDPMVYEWEGSLYAGEIKLCLVKGSWDVPFIRPVEDQRAISQTNIVGEEFQMHAGDPDEKWRVTDAGKYRLSFNLRDWTYSTYYLGGQDAPTIEPIEAEEMYLVGDATPAGWNIDGPTELTKTGDYTFVYTGKLKAGEMKGYIETGNWNAPAIRPASDGVKIGRSGVEDENFVFAAAPDNKWVVEETAMYEVTFDLENWKISVVCTGDAPEEEPTDPLMDATAIYMIGDATPGSWGWDGCSVFSATGVAHEFSWTGELATGDFKCYVEKGNYDAPALRPSTHGVEVSKSGVADSTVEFRTDPDDKWTVTEAGYYTITINLEKMTITAKYQGEEEPALIPIETEVLYMLGNATPNGWDNGNQTEFTKTGDYTFVWEGYLKADEMKACMQQGSWDVPFIRPVINLNENNLREVGAEGVENEAFQMHAWDPDEKWLFTVAGNYRLTFDLKNWTYSIKYLD